MLNFIAKVFIDIAMFILMLKARLKNIKCVYKIDDLGDDIGFDVKIRWFDNEN